MQNCTCSALASERSAFASCHCSCFLILPSLILIPFASASRCVRGKLFHGGKSARTGCDADSCLHRGATVVCHSLPARNQVSGMPFPQHVSYAGALLCNAEHFRTFSQPLWMPELISVFEMQCFAIRAQVVVEFVPPQCEINLYAGFTLVRKLTEPVPSPVLCGKCLRMQLFSSSVFAR